MKRACFVCLFLSLTATFSLSQSNPIPLINHTAKVESPGVVSWANASQADPKAQARILDGYGKLPLSFEANQGQTDARVKFLSRTGGYSLFLTGDEAVLTLRGGKADTNKAKIAGIAHPLKSGMAVPRAGGVLRMKLHNANPAAKVTGADELAGTSNYFIGNDPKKWRTNVPTYAKVKYEAIYPGIDLVYYGNQRQLEYDFVVGPGADPRRIEFDVRGAKRIRRDAHGELVLKIGEGEIRWHKPVVYQEKNGAKQLLAANYVITDTNRVGFEVAKYDAGRPLYIDPLIYSTYLGGSGEDGGVGIAVDISGNTYVTGSTGSTDFPTTSGAFQTNFAGGYYDVFVAKLNPTGSALVYSTYLGGGVSDEGSNIAVDSAGNAYVTGFTTSSNFPVTPGAFQTNLVGSLDVFVTKLNPTGSALVYSTYLGGGNADGGFGIAVDSSGDAYVTGTTQSINFPTTPGAFQTNFAGGYDDVFVTKLNLTGSALVYSTYLGGSGHDDGRDIVVDSPGDAYVTGTTSSHNFPLEGPSQKRHGRGHYDVFVSRLNPTGSALWSSTYLGGDGYDDGLGIAVGSEHNAYVTGLTMGAFPVTPGAFQTNFAGGFDDAFVAKIQMLAATTTTLTSSPNPSTYGQAVTFAAAVNSRLGAPPDGETVTFMKGTKILGTGALSGGSASFTTSTLSVGTLLVKAVFGGDSDFLSSTSKALSQDVNKATTTTTLTSSLNPSNVGQAVTFTASVAPQFSGTVTGTVTFYDGATALKTVRLSGGKTKFTTSTLTSGTHIITATYNGSTSFTGSSASLTQTVN